MKRFVVFLVVVGLVFSLASPVHAEDAFKKLGRGVANVLTCPFELPKGMGDAREENGIFAGLTWGIFQGIQKTVTRAVVGVYEIATFPLPVPEGYKPILTDPEFFLQKD